MNSIIFSLMPYFSNMWSLRRIRLKKAITSAIAFFAEYHTKFANIPLEKSRKCQKLLVWKHGLDLKSVGGVQNCSSYRRGALIADELLAVLNLSKMGPFSV